MDSTSTDALSTVDTTVVVLNMGYVEQLMTTRSACNCSDSTQKGTPSADSITNNGGFIAMAAGLSIIMPLVCVLVIQLNRAKKAERARSHAEARARENGSFSDPEIDPPPLYEQLFGPNFNPSLVVHAGHDCLNVLVDENGISHPVNMTIDNGIDYRLANVWTEWRTPGVTDDSCVLNSSQLYMQGLGSGPEYPNTSVAIISGSHITDVPSSCGILQRYLTHEVAYPSTIETSSTFSQRTIDQNTSHMTSFSDQSSLSEPTTSFSTPQTSPSQIPLHTPLFPQSHQTWRYNSNNISGSRQVQETLTYHPGMHISVEDFLASLGGLQDNDPDIPPPSYEEALKILESVAHVKDMDDAIK